MARYLFVDGGLHSFAAEIGRFTKTSGFHYDVYLHPPRIVHHNKYWEVKPYLPGWFVVNGTIYISKKCVEDEKGRTYAGLRVPFNAVYTAEELYDRIIEAALKYVLARFLSISADGEKLTLRVSFKLYDEGKPAVEPAPIREGLKLLRGLEELRHYEFLEEIGTVMKTRHDLRTRLRFKYVVTLHPLRVYSYEKPLWGWEIKPRRGLFVLNERYTFGPQHVIDEKTNEWYDGIATSSLYDQKLYLPASSIYSAIVEAVAKYTLVKFLGWRRAKEFEGKEITITFESTH